MNNLPNQSIPNIVHFVSCVNDCPTVEEAASRPCMSRPCPTCPYRRNVKPWVDAWRWLINVFRLRERRVQSCHNAPHMICHGAVVAIAGGSSEILSADEFEQITPAPTLSVSQRRYDSMQPREKNLS